ncbi:hypothetical protein [Mycolicibacterium hodleri]|nr:hypothetical protein [Mycolicibacterium hodleri]
MGLTGPDLPDKPGIPIADLTVRAGIVGVPSPDDPNRIAGIG